MTYPPKEEMIKYIEAFTPYKVRGTSLDYICEIYIKMFGADWYRGLIRRN